MTAAFGSFEQTYNGIHHRYSIELRDLTDDDPDYLDGEWWCLIDESQHGRPAVEYALPGANQPAPSDAHFNAAIGRFKRQAWFSQEVNRRSGL